MYSKVDITSGMVSQRGGSPFVYGDHVGWSVSPLENPHFHGDMHSIRNPSLQKSINWTSGNSKSSFSSSCCCRCYFSVSTHVSKKPDGIDR